MAHTPPGPIKNIVNPRPGLTVYLCGCKAVKGDDLRVELCLTHNAAPEMLAVIRAILFSANEDYEVNPTTLATARALLARVEGEKP